MLAIVSVNDRIDFQSKSYDYVLVVEDDPWDEELLVSQLRKTQMSKSLLFAQNGWQALNSSRIPNVGDGDSAPSFLIFTCRHEWS